ncbi:tetratricopeptide repeat protein [Pseudophaeobacter sp.]|uniref:tetratricopeptide repeat protein n=1 Tax=Pseudophaeobacter sp. TaxID=1971739 RepID=UPI00405A0BE5
MWSTDDLDQALSCLTQAITKEPQQSLLYSLRALVHGAQGQEHEALADFEAALKYNPDNLECLVNASRPLARQTRHQDSQ